MNYDSTLLTPDQVAKILQIHVLTVYSYIRQGKFDAVRLGRTYRIVPEDLDRFVESNKFKNNESVVLPQNKISSDRNQRSTDGGDNGHK